MSLHGTDQPKTSVPYPFRRVAVRTCTRFCKGYHSWVESRHNSLSLPFGFMHVTNCGIYFTVLHEVGGYLCRDRTVSRQHNQITQCLRSMVTYFFCAKSGAGEDSLRIRSNRHEELTFPGLNLDVLCGFHEESSLFGADLPQSTTDCHFSSRRWRIGGAVECELVKIHATYSDPNLCPQSVSLHFTPDHPRKSHVPSTVLGPLQRNKEE